MEVSIDDLEKIVKECSLQYPEFSSSSFNKFFKEKNDKWLKTMISYASQISSKYKIWNYGYQELVGLTLKGKLFTYTLQVGLKMIYEDFDYDSDSVDNTRVWYVSRGHCLISLAMHLTP